MSKITLAATPRSAECRRMVVPGKLLANLPPETLDRLLYAATETRVARGDTVFRRGEMPTGIYILRTGHLKLCVEDPAGEEHVVEILQPGDSCSEAAIVTEQAHLLNAIAVEECQLLHIPRLTVLSEVNRSHEFGRRMIERLSDRLYRRTGDLENILLRTAVGRVARFLVDELERNYPNAPDATKIIRLEVGKGLIASKLNMTQEHFSRTLHALSVRGKIQVQGRSIAIVNEEGLRSIAA